MDTTICIVKQLLLTLSLWKQGLPDMLYKYLKFIENLCHARRKS